MGRWTEEEDKARIARLKEPQINGDSFCRIIVGLESGTSVPIIADCRVQGFTVTWTKECAAALVLLRLACESLAKLHVPAGEQVEVSRVQVSEDVWRSNSGRILCAEEIECVKQAVLEGRATYTFEPEPITAS